MFDWKVPFFDWPSTEGYVREIARLFNLDLWWMWRDYGMWGELHRKNSLTNDVHYAQDIALMHKNSLILGKSELYAQQMCNIVRLATVRGKESTRLKWPAKSPSLQTRWCSAYLKIDVGRRVLNDRFKEGKFLFCTGERREESPNRSRYLEFEPHAVSGKKRQIDHWRPVIDWTEKDIWEILNTYGIVPHPAYYLGFPRLSCMSCIFFGKDHWATLNEVNPAAIDLIAQKEKEFNFTLDNKYSIRELVSMGKSSITNDNKHFIQQALNEYTKIPKCKPEDWQLPKGAFGKGGGSL